MDSDRTHKNTFSHSAFIFLTEQMAHLSIGEISEMLVNFDSDCETEIDSFSDYSLCNSDEIEQEYSLTSEKKRQSTSWSSRTFISITFDFDSSNSGINEGLNIDNEPIDYFRKLYQ